MSLYPITEISRQPLSILLFDFLLISRRDAAALAAKTAKKQEQKAAGEDAKK